MSGRSDVAPSTLGVELTEDGIVVEYEDGRQTFYHGVPEKREDVLRAQPGREVHVLVTDPSGTEGALTYVNDRMTSDDILEETGVGRVLLDAGDEKSVFPGVTVRRDAYAVEVEVDPGEAGGRVFVFEEDERSEYSYEFVE